MTRAELKALTDSELRKKYFAKKARALKLPGCSMVYKGEKKLIWKMLPGGVANSLGRLADEWNNRFEWNDKLKHFQKRNTAKQC